jgi:hypothetical protein
MTRKQAQNLMEDLGKNLTPSDFSESVYLSIKGVGTKTFRKCAYYEVDGFTFIWTKEDTYIISKEELGEFVIIPIESSLPMALSRKVT